MQVAKQQGDYLADLFRKNRLTGDPSTSITRREQPNFKYSHKVRGACSVLFPVQTAHSMPLLFSGCASPRCKPANKVD
jgi:hypothetical protein